MAEYEGSILMQEVEAGQKGNLDERVLADTLDQEDHQRKTQDLRVLRFHIQGPDASSVRKRVLEEIEDGMVDQVGDALIHQKGEIELCPPRHHVLIIQSSYLMSQDAVGDIYASQEM